MPRPGGAAAPALWVCLLLFVRAVLLPAWGAQEAGRPYDDHDLEQAARDRLQRLHELRTASLSVSVRAGLARIEGQADSLAQVEKARRAVAQVRGIAELDNRIQVRDTASDDLRLTLELEREIERFPGLQGLAVEIRVAQAAATLEGRVHTAGERRLLLEAARGVAGLRSVELRLEVAEGSDKDDAALQRQIRGLLADRVRFPIQGRVQATVRDRTAVLEGVVQRLIDRLDAEEVAWHASGLRGVQNLIQVVPRPRVRHYSEMEAQPAGAERAAPRPDPETPEREVMDEDD